MRAGRRATCVALGLALVSCSSEANTTSMPSVTGKTLDVAKSDIERAGFDDDVEVLGGGALGVIVESNWEVCDQRPAAGQPLKAPRLTVKRECNPTTATPSPESTPSHTPPAPASPVSVPPNAARITADALYDKLNANDVQNGDRFRLVAELVGEEIWGKGASGEYTVYVKVKGGANDFFFFVDEEVAQDWHNGTRVDLVVEARPATLNGETSDGWLWAIYTNTLSG